MPARAPSPPSYPRRSRRPPRRGRGVRLRHRPRLGLLLAKLVITGADRTQALQRAARALDEFQVEGMATALTFHRTVVRDKAFTSDPFDVHTRWIETEFDNTIPPFTPSTRRRPTRTGRRAGRPSSSRSAASGSKSRSPRRWACPPPGPPRGRLAQAKRKAPKKSGSAASGDALASPMQGTIVKLAVGGATRSPRATW
ncbi:hypothetical protein NKH77_22205 [Streptomyces sp. M19]